MLLEALTVQLPVGFAQLADNIGTPVISPTAVLTEPESRTTDVGETRGENDGTES